MNVALVTFLLRMEVVARFVVVAMMDVLEVIDDTVVDAARDVVVFDIAIVFVVLVVLKLLN